MLALLTAGAVAAVRPAADEVRVMGRVVDAATGHPLAGAQVTIPGASGGVLTDMDGRYDLTIALDRGDVRELVVRVVLIGYAAGESRVQLGAPTGRLREVRADFALTATAVELDQIVVTGDRAETRGRAERDAATRERPVERSAVPETAGRVRSNVAPTQPAKVATQPSTPTAEIAGLGDERRHPWSAHRYGDREQYAYIDENPYRSAEDEPLSTFSIDVDRASYANIRRFLQREHTLPPVDAVQIEEMVNYFAYDYQLPRGDDPVAVTTELGRAPWNRAHTLLRVGLASRPIATEDLPPSNLVFLIDVSGSMSSEDKLPLAQASLKMLTRQLRPQDHVAIVVYAGAAGLVLEPTSGARKGDILDAIDRLRAGGSTAGGEGLRLAYEVARRHWRRGGNNRVVLATDGDFNVGESSDGAMVRLVTEQREHGTALSVLGFGTGNLQNEKMQAMAQHGNGNYAYIDGVREAYKVLVREMGGTLVTVAKDVKVQVEFNPERVAAYRLLGYENRMLAAEDFNDDRKDAGEVGAGHTVTALYEIVPVDADDARARRVDPLRYGTRARTSSREHGDELAFVKVRYKAPQGRESRLLQRGVADRVEDPSADFRFASAVAGFGMLLRGSEHAGDLTAGEVIELAESGIEHDRDGSRAEFISLVRTYRTIAGDRVAHRR